MASMITAEAPKIRHLGTAQVSGFLDMRYMGDIQLLA